MSTRHSDCERALALLMDFLKRELPAEDAERVRRHLEDCPPCAGHSRFERSFVTLLEERLGGGNCPEPVKAKILAALRREMPQ